MTTTIKISANKSPFRRIGFMGESPSENFRNTTLLFVILVAFHQRLPTKLHSMYSLLALTSLILLISHVSAYGWWPTGKHQKLIYWPQYANCTYDFNGIESSWQYENMITWTGGNDELINYPCTTKSVVCYYCESRATMR